MHAAHDRVTRLQRAFFDQNSCNGSPARVDFSFDNMTGGQFVRVGFELQDFSLKRNHFKQVVNSLRLSGGYFDINRISSPRFRGQSNFSQFPLHFIGFGILFVDFIDGHDDGHLSCSGMIDRLGGLGHDTIIGSNDQNHNVGHLGPSCSHCRESFVAGRIQEGDLPLVRVDQIGADMLRNSAGLHF